MYKFKHILGFPDSSVGKESACNVGDLGLIPELGRSPGEGIGSLLQYSWASPVAQLVKESACNVGDLGLIPGLGRTPGEGNGYSLQYSGLENSMDCTVHGVAKSWTRLSDFHRKETVSLEKWQSGSWEPLQDAVFPGSWLESAMPEQI